MTRIPPEKTLSSSEQRKCTIFVGNWPYTATTDDLQKTFSEIGPIKRCFVVKDKGVGYVTFALREDAQSAIEKVKTYGGRKLNLKFSIEKQKQGKAVNNKAEANFNAENAKTKNKLRTAKDRFKKEAKIKPPFNETGKMVVRNLSFKAAEDDVRKIFQAYGPVVEVNIPKRPDGKMMGCCFVRMKNEEDAVNAIAGVNNQKILGRPVAVDYVVPQKEYQQIKLLEAKFKGNLNDDLNFTLDNNMGESSVKETGQKQSDNTSSNSDDDGLSDMEEDEDDMSDVEEDKDSQSEMEDSMEESEEEEKDDDNPGSRKKSMHKKEIKRRNSKNKSEVTEGKTLFVRNIRFTTTEEQFKEAFAIFGKLEYAVICYDPVTEHSKGTGFVKFTTKESANVCLSNQAVDGGIILDGEKLLVSIALSKEAMKKTAADNKEKKKKDNRNLYLAREGLIRPGTQAAEGVSKQDMDKRMGLENRKRIMLNNNQMFISKDRLSVRNIPLSMNEHTLKAIFRKAGGPGAQISKVIIMRSKKKFDSNGIGKPQGHGFIQFDAHEHALRALRSINNNPHIFTPNSRPIVEFSVENHSALRVQKMRLENSIRKNKQIQESKNPGQRSGKRKVSGEKMDRAGKRQKIQKSTEQVDISDKIDTFVGTKSESLDASKSKTMPSHFGPKIRHKQRPGVAAKALKKTAQKIQKRKREEILKAQEKRKNRKNRPPPKNVQKVNESEANLDRLVENYQKKLSKSKDRNYHKKSKWF